METIRCLSSLPCLMACSAFPQGLLPTPCLDTTKGATSCFSQWDQTSPCGYSTQPSTTSLSDKSTDVRKMTDLHQDLSPVIHNPTGKDMDKALKSTAHPQHFSPRSVPRVVTKYGSKKAKHQPLARHYMMNREIHSHHLQLMRHGFLFSYRSSPQKSGDNLLGWRKLRSNDLHPFLTEIVCST